MRMSVDKLFQSGRKIDQRPAANNAHFHRGLRPQVGNVEHQLCASEPTDQPPRQSQKKRWRLYHHNVVSCDSSNPNQQGGQDEGKIIEESTYKTFTVCRVDPT